MNTDNSFQTLNCSAVWSVYNNNDDNNNNTHKHTYLKWKKTVFSVVWATVSTTVIKIKADNLTLKCYSTIKILEHYYYSNSDKNITTPNKWIRVCIFF